MAVSISVNGEIFKMIVEKLFTEFIKFDTLSTKLFIIDVWLKLKIVPDSSEYTGFWKFGPYWVQK